MKKIRLAVLLTLLVSSFSLWALNWTPQFVSETGPSIVSLFNILVWLSAIIFIGVFVAIVWACVYHRKQPGRVPATFHENTKVEILWTVIPTIILALLAIPATKSLLELRDSSQADLTIKVTGYQWRWGYDYKDKGISFFSALSTPREQIEGKAPKGENYLLEVDKPLVVPAGKKIRLLFTSADVIHAWYVPQLAVQQDTVPGIVRDGWFKVDKPGTYRGQCNKICGKEHAFMPIVVEVVSQQDFDAWVTKNRSTAANQ